MALASDAMERFTSRVVLHMTGDGVDALTAERTAGGDTVGLAGSLPLSPRA